MAGKDYSSCPLKVKTAAQCHQHRDGSGDAICRWCEISPMYRTLNIPLTFQTFEDLKEACILDGIGMDKGAGRIIEQFFKKVRKSLERRHCDSQRTPRNAEA